MTDLRELALALWSDDPSPTDLLSFDAVGDTIADALLDESLDPVALGLSGSWGSGKTTVLGLVEAALQGRTSKDQKILVIRTEPWRYDPATGAKESLIGEVLDALAAEIDASQTTVDGAKEKAKKLVGRLVRRVDWAKAVKLTAKTSLAFQIPSVNEIIDLVKPADGEEEDEVRGLDAFRAEFKELMSSDALSHVRAVAVLVDDLDRCLPESVIESLEAIRLFLAVPKMSFVIAADEDRVADAIRSRFSETGAPVEKGISGEEPAKLYLHKIVQTTIPLPALSRFDTQAFLLLLQLQPDLEPDTFASVVDRCAAIRAAGGGLDDLTSIEGVEMQDQLAFASRLTPILYEKLHGNPRRIKRFLNDLRVRQAIAARRGIALDPAVIAKLMVLEVLLPDDFEMVLGWLAQGELRLQLASLEMAAGRSTGDSPAAPKASSNGEGSEETPSESENDDSRSEFSEGLLRWVKLPPGLTDVDVAPYLHLAAAFSGKPLLDTGLAEHLRDVAANLLSSSRADRQAVSDEDLSSVSQGEAEELILHLGRTIRDEPTKQKTGATAILRIARINARVAKTAKRALLMLPAEDLALGTPLLFTKDDDPELFSVLGEWRERTSNQQLRNAIDNALKQQAIV